MTKKSYGRLQRDLQEAKTKNAQKMRADYFKKNTGWDDAQQLYQSAAELVAGTGATIQGGFSDRSIFTFFNQQEMVEVNTAIGGMSKDLELFTNDLLALRSKHHGRSGAVTTDEDFSIILEIGQEYSDFTTRFSAVVAPNQKFLTDKLAVALTRRAEAQKAAAQDVNVVTDVTTKTAE